MDAFGRITTSTGTVTPLLQCATQTDASLCALETSTSTCSHPLRLHVEGYGWDGWGGGVRLPFPIGRLKSLKYAGVLCDDHREHGGLESRVLLCLLSFALKPWGIWMA